jgi:hypothetical protein
MSEIRTPIQRLFRRAERSGARAFGGRLMARVVSRSERAPQGPRLRVLVRPSESLLTQLTRRALPSVSPRARVIGRCVSRLQPTLRFGPRSTPHRAAPVLAPRPSVTRAPRRRATGSGRSARAPSSSAGASDGPPEGPAGAHRLASVPLTHSQRLSDPSASSFRGRSVFASRNPARAGKVTVASRVAPPRGDLQWTS